jgi:predicted amino acid dehydrogenase
MKNIYKSIKNYIKLIRDSFILPYIPASWARKIAGTYDYAFLIHPRNHADFARQYPISKFFPQRITAFLFSFFGPITVSEITGLVDREGKSKRGLLISLLFTPEMLFGRRNAAEKSIVSAARLSEKLGVSILGLGALTSSISSRGKKIIKKVKKIGVTTGHANTVVVVVRNLMRVFTYLNLNKNETTIAIIGAAGSVGNACVRLLLKKGFTRFILVDHKFDLLSDQCKHLLKTHPSVDLQKSEKVPNFIDADFVITATNAPYAVIYSGMLKPGAIVLDDAQPSDMDDSLSLRHDVLPVEAGVIRYPGIDAHFDFGLEYKDDVYGCLGEAMLLSWMGKTGHYVIDNVKDEQLEEVEELHSSMGFQNAELRSFGKIYSLDDLERIKKARIQWT